MTSVHSIAISNNYEPQYPRVCFGITKKNRRCMKVTCNKPLCHIHIYQNVDKLRCFGITTKGVRCRIMLNENTNEYCCIHDPNMKKSNIFHGSLDQQMINFRDYS